MRQRHSAIGAVNIDEVFNFQRRPRHPNNRARPIRFQAAANESAIDELQILKGDARWIRHFPQLLAVSIPQIEVSSIPVSTDQPLRSNRHRSDMIVYPELRSQSQGSLIPPLDDRAAF